MKARTMVYLDPGELQALRAEARAAGISLAELVRRVVRQHRQQNPLSCSRPTGCLEGCARRLRPPPARRFRTQRSLQGGKQRRQNRNVLRPH